jgi:hypothetical protein
MIQLMYFIGMAIMQLSALVAFILFTNQSGRQWRWGRQPSSQANELFKQQHIDLSIKQYQGIRSGLFGMFALASVYQMLSAGQVSVITVSLLVVLFYLTSPNPLMFNTKFSLLRLGLNAFQHRKQKQKQNDLFLLITYLKTLAMMQREDSFIDILSLLCQHATHVKTELQHLLRQCQLENTDEQRRLIHQFTKSIGGIESDCFEKALTKLIDNPLENVKQELTLHQQRSIERRQTERESKDERKNELFFGLATVLFMLILLNFIVVGIMSSELFNVM